MAEYLELVMPIVDDNNQATPYFEDYLYQIIQGLGGEGSNTIETAIVNSESAANIPYMSGYINRLAKRIETLEGDLRLYKVAHQISQLQIETAGYIATTKNTLYTAKHNEWIEATSNAQITLPKNSLTNHRVRVANGDGSQIKVSAGVGEKIKIRGSLEDCVTINTAGNSYDFQWFGDYWRLA